MQLEIKSELQIHFNTIVDLSNYIRTIVSPYSKIAQKIEFDNISRPSERVKINIPESNTLIILDWNILAIINLGKTKELDKNSGPFKFLYNIYSEIEQKPYFYGVKQTKLLLWDLIETEQGEFDNFRRKYVSKEFRLPDYADDLSITIEGKNKKKNYDYNIGFGPFKDETDIEKHNLHLFGKNIIPVEKMKGKSCLLNSNFTSHNSKFHIKQVSEMMELKEELTKSIF